MPEITDRNIFLPHTGPGQVRRRVRDFVGVNPNQTAGGSPAITWVIEDEILLDDGKYVYVPAGTFVTPLTSEGMAETFVDIDIETGASTGEVYSVGKLMRMFQSFALQKMVNQHTANPPPPGNAP